MFFKLHKSKCNKSDSSDSSELSLPCGKFKDVQIYIEFNYCHFFFFFETISSLMPPLKGVFGFFKSFYEKFFTGFDFKSLGLVEDLDWCTNRRGFLGLEDLDLEWCVVCMIDGF